MLELENIKNYVQIPKPSSGREVDSVDSGVNTMEKIEDEMKKLHM